MNTSQRKIMARGLSEEKWVEDG